MNKQHTDILINVLKEMDIHSFSVGFYSIAHDGRTYGRIQYGDKFEWSLINMCLADEDIIEIMKILDWKGIING